MSLGYTGSAGTTLSDITTSFAFDGVGNLVATFSPNRAPIAHQYDSLNRLIRTYVVAAHDDEVDYVYDPDGNRISEEVKGVRTY